MSTNIHEIDQPAQASHWGEMDQRSTEFRYSSQLNPFIWQQLLLLKNILITVCLELSIEIEMLQCINGFIPHAQTEYIFLQIQNTL